MYNPGSTRYISYQISNPQDLSTLYYVQVIVRYSNGLLQVANINLISKGSGLYTGSYQIPQSDPNGLVGDFDIFETLSVYTDSRYSSLSPSYSIVNTPINVGFIATNASQLNGPGGGYDLTDYSFVRKIIKEELALLQLPQPIKPDSVDISPLTNLLSGVTPLLNTHKAEFLKDLQNHREDIARGFEGMNNNYLSINDRIDSKLDKLSLAKIEKRFTELEKTLEGNVKKGLEKLAKLHAGEYEELPIKYRESLAKLSEENETLKEKILTQVKDILSEYFGSVHTMIIDQGKGVPKMEKKEIEPEPKPQKDYLNIASSFIRKPATK